MKKKIVIITLLSFIICIFYYISHDRSNQNLSISKEIYFKYIDNIIKMNSAINILDIDVNSHDINKNMIKQITLLAEENYYNTNGIIGNSIDVPFEVTEFSLYVNDFFAYFDELVLTGNITEKDINNLKKINTQLETITFGIGENYREKYKNMSEDEIRQDLFKRIQPSYKAGYGGFYQPQN
nr:hypothetical protein [Lysinibacillus timonensis]